MCSCNNLWMGTNSGLYFNGCQNDVTITPLNQCRIYESRSSIDTLICPHLYTYYSGLLRTIKLVCSELVLPSILLCCCPADLPLYLSSSVYYKNICRDAKAAFDTASNSCISTISSKGYPIKRWSSRVFKRISTSIEV